MKCLVAVTITAVVGIPLALVGWNMYQASRPPHAVSCAKALAYIGWKLPEHTRDHQCVESVDAFSSNMSGTFRMPRTDARPWLASLPGNRFRTAGAEADGVLVTEDGLHLGVVKPRHPKVDEARVTVRFEGKDTALVSFETFDY
ncbi:hypothetical protein [Streptomyces syringium]|uniref:Uncharacterized protein n=1 Tax=Streptomyces syringium TaxID=76729 RepID=A0ABS4XYC1_9ACTN|nr:hypothetical protein [Streptomyces syringium]MBP2400708.1 hypothetical protein [Streptomyces syringium]